MPTVKMRYERESIQEFRIDKDGVLTIGRDKANDIVIDNLGVSAFHARLDSVDDRFMLTDLKSTNGTFVNDELITSRWIRHGDVIIIGKHVLIFTYGQDEVRPPGDSPPKEETMVLRTDMHQELLDRNYGKCDRERIDRKDVGALVFLEGGTGEVVLENKLIKIGKDPLSDVFVGGLLVGKTAAAISNRTSGYYLSYVGGLAKPKVNGEAVRESVKLEEFDVIGIGSAKMQFVRKFVYSK